MREEPGAGAASSGRSVPGGTGRRGRGLPADHQLDRERPLPAVLAARHRSRAVLRHDRRSDLSARRQGAAMMTRTTASGHRGAAAAVLVAGGVAVAVATWIAGDHGWAIAALAVYIVFAILASAWAGRSGDIAAILRVGGDERQRGLDRDATAISGLAMTLVAIVGAIISLGRTGNPGVYGFFCVVGGLA